MKNQLEGTVVFDGIQVYWSLWNGEQLGNVIAIDTETTLIEDRSTVPDLCLVSVSDGEQHFVLEPEQLPEFLELHSSDEIHFVFHHVGFDFPVIDKCLAIQGQAEARNTLWAAVDSDRVHDTMLLAALVSLAERDCDIIPGLKDACEEHLGVVLEKDKYRHRFNEIRNKSWTDVDVGFFQYAVKDAVATWFLFTVLTHKANEICHEHGVADDHGFLTEAIQVKAAIALDRITRNGMAIDLDRLGALRTELEAAISKVVDEILKIAPDVWHTVTATNVVAINEETGLPRVNQKALRSHLLGVADKHEIEPPRTPSGDVSLSTKTFWNQYRDVDPLIDLYCEYVEKTKQRTFIDGLAQSRIHPRYHVLKRTGRTSCSKPNIQQLPARSPIREAVVASPGNALCIIDYSCLELRTLASECHRLYGHSQLREVLIEGEIPTATQLRCSQVSARMNSKSIRTESNCGSMPRRSTSESLAV